MPTRTQALKSVQWSGECLGKSEECLLTQHSWRSSRNHFSGVGCCQKLILEEGRTLLRFCTYLPLTFCYDTKVCAFKGHGYSASSSLLNPVA